MLLRPTLGSTVRLCAVSDIGLAGRGAVTTKLYGATKLFVDVAPVLRSVNIVFGSLVSPPAGEIAANEAHR